MSVALCRFCKKVYIELVWTRFGQRMPFEHELVAVDSLACPDDGWVPGEWTIGRETRLAMAPLSHYDDSRQATARRVAVLHRCRRLRSQRQPVQSAGTGRVVA